MVFGDFRSSGVFRRFFEVFKSFRRFSHFFGGLSRRFSEVLKGFGGFGRILGFGRVWEGSGKFWENSKKTDFS